MAFNHSKQVFLLLLLLSNSDVALSVSLSQYEQISGVSSGCLSVWSKDIPGCLSADFSPSNNGCSSRCFVGLNVINTEVQQACADAQASSDTLLGKFLEGLGISTICSGGAATLKSEITSSTSSSSTTTSTSQSQKTTTTTTAANSAPQTTQVTEPTTQLPQNTNTHTVQETTSTQSNTQSNSQSTTTTTTTTTEPASNQLSRLTITATDADASSTTTTTAAQQTSHSTSAASSSSTTSSADNTEANGFGGVGNAFDILGGESSAARVEIAWVVGMMVFATISAMSMATW